MSKRGGRGQAGDGSTAVVIVRRTEEGGGAGHHGGAWKIAYADFVTAMMAFFLLMWLVNATTEAQRRGIADYFAPHNPLGRVTTGSGQPFGGRTLASEGQMISDGAMALALARRDPRAPNEELDDEGVELPERARPIADDGRGHGGAPSPSPAADTQPTQPSSNDADERRQREELRRVGEEIRMAVRADPQLAGLAQQLIVEEVPEGLRIQVVDSDGQAVFATGHAAPNERGRALLQRVAATLARLPHPIEITGHTDAAPFRGGDVGRSNWELSAERANATRRLMLDAGIGEGRMRAIAGRADRELLRSAQPLDPSNRRVAVLVLVPPLSAQAAVPTTVAASR